MSGYAVYVYSAWLIAYVAIGVFVFNDHRKLNALLKRAKDISPLQKQVKS